VNLFLTDYPRVWGFQIRTEHPNGALRPNTVQLTLRAQAGGQVQNTLGPVNLPTLSATIAHRRDDSD
jgi:hypothetical protein